MAASKAEALHPSRICCALPCEAAEASGAAASAARVAIRPGMDLDAAQQLLEGAVVVLLGREREARVVLLLGPLGRLAVVEERAQLLVEGDLRRVVGRL